MERTGWAAAQRTLRALVIAGALMATCLAGGAGATSLMTQDGVFSSTNPADGQLKDIGYSVAGYMGAQYMRMTVARDTAFTWTAADTFVDEARARGLTPYLTLTYRPTNWGTLANAMAIPSNAEFAFWCRQSAQHFQGRVFNYSIWNEPNQLAVGPSGSSRTLTAAESGSLYRACYGEIKAIEPNAKVYLGELATKVGSCDYLAGALPTSVTTFTDGVAIHPYQFTTPPTTALPDDCRGIGNLTDWNARIAGLASANRLKTPQGGTPRLVVGEFGYCTLDGECDGSGNGRDETTRAQWIQAAYALAQENGVSIFSYYHLVKAADPTQNVWDSGIVNRDVTVTPSVPALRQAVGGARNPESDVNGDGLADLVTLQNLDATHGTGWVFPGGWDRVFRAAPVSSFAGTMDPAEYDNVGHHVVDVADVNGDGLSDLVTLTSANVTCTYLGRTNGNFPGPCVESFRDGTTGQGTMVPEILPGSPGGHEPIGVADVTGDGRADLVTFASPLGVTITYPGTASGSFGVGVFSFAGTMDSARLDGVGHYFVDLADVTGDGHADLVTQYTGLGGGVAVYPGQSSGAFLDATLTSGIVTAMNSGSGIEPIGVADVTGDGRAEFVGFDTASHNVLVYPGQSNGALGAGIPSFAGTMVSRLFGGGSGHEIGAVIDINGDRKADLVTAFFGSAGPGSVAVYEGRPNGTFVDGAMSFPGGWQTAQFGQYPGQQLAMEKPVKRRRGCTPTSCSP